MAQTPEPDADMAPALREPGAARLDLEQAFKGLTLPQRLCVGLCYGADLTHAEAAALLNVPLGTVKSHVKRGLDTLRAALTPAEHTGSQSNG
jgi:DNA-directed RNA polymerase specialized sigma24 family protein